MLKLVGLILGQSVLLVAAQILLKISVNLFGTFSWSWKYFKIVFTTWQFALSGICAITGLITWMYALKHYKFSLVYPLLSISYIIGLVAAWLFLNETIPLTRWIGVVIIVIGVYFVVK
ncbi:MAG: EamA family transporter [Marinilabiliaceae bacterium]|nr:EamA family transporter [Marinilabiliaceae bacterium]